MLNILLMGDNTSRLFSLGLSKPAKKSIPAINLTLEHTFFFLWTSHPFFLSLPISSSRLLSFSELHDNKVISASVPLSYVDKDGIFHPISLSRWFGLKPFIVNRERSVEITRRWKQAHFSFLLECFFRRWSYWICLNSDERCGDIVTHRCKMFKLLEFYLFYFF